jgi:hypothetical protein
MSTLLNLTGQLDAETVNTLSDVNDVATQLNIPYIIVGATARDLILHHGYGAAVVDEKGLVPYVLCLKLHLGQVGQLLCDVSSK